MCQPHPQSVGSVGVGWGARVSNKLSGGGAGGCGFLAVRLPTHRLGGRLLGSGSGLQGRARKGSKSPHQVGRAALCPLGAQGLSGGLSQPLNDLSHLSDLHGQCFLGKPLMAVLPHFQPGHVHFQSLPHLSFLELSSFQLCIDLYEATRMSAVGCVYLFTHH